jgi:hypothetical protein
MLRFKLNSELDIAVGFVTANVVEVNRLSSCELAKRVSACGKPLFMCSLGCGVCRSDGERVRFRFCSRSGLYRVTWVCDKLS